MPPKDTTKQQRETLYQNLVEDGYSLGSFSDFDSALSDTETRKTFYSNLLEDGYELGEYANFEKGLGYSSTLAKPAINLPTTPHASPNDRVKTKEATPIKQPKQPQKNPFDLIIGSVKQTVAKLENGLKKDIKQGKENLQDMVGRVKENGIPKTSEEALNLIYGRQLEAATSEAVESWKSDEASQHIPESMQVEAFNRSPYAKTLNQKVDSLALEFEGSLNPMSKVAQLMPRIEKLRQRREELNQQLSDVDNQLVERGYTAEEAKLIKEREQLFNELTELSREVSKPLELIADKGLSKLDELVQPLQTEMSELQKTPLQQRSYEVNLKVDKLFRRGKALEIAKKLYSNLKDIANASTDNSWKSLWQGISNNDYWELLSFGTASILENFNIAQIAEKVSNEKEVSSEEQLALETYGIYNQLASQKELPVTYGIGQSFIQSLPFMAEIALTGGLRAAVSEGVEGLVKRGLSKAVGKATSKALAKGVGYAAGTLAAVPIQPMTYKNLSERQLGNYHINEQGNVQKSERAESVPESLGWASLNTFITLASEDGIGGFAQGMKYTGKGVGRILGKTKKVTSSSKVGAYMKSLQKHTRWNGFLQEIGEEYDEALLTNLFVPATAAEQDRMEADGTSRWDDFFDPKRAAEIAGSIALTQLLMSSPAKVQRLYQTGKAKVDLYKTQSRLPESVSRRLVEALNMPDLAQQQQAVEAIDFSELDNEELNAVGKYLLAKSRCDILTGREQGKQELEQEEKVEGLFESIRFDSSDKVQVGINTDGKSYFVLTDNGSDAVVVADIETGEKKNGSTLFTC